MIKKFSTLMVIALLMVGCDTDTMIREDKETIVRSGTVVDVKLMKKMTLVLRYDDGVVQTYRHAIRQTECRRLKVPRRFDNIRLVKETEYYASGKIEIDYEINFNDVKKQVCK